MPVWVSLGLTSKKNFSHPSHQPHMYMQNLSLPAVDITSAILLWLQTYHIKMVDIFFLNGSRTSFALSVITMGITMHDLKKKSHTRNACGTVRERDWISGCGGQGHGTVRERDWSMRDGVGAGPIFSPAQGSPLGKLGRVGVGWGDQA